VPSKRVLSVKLLEDLSIRLSCSRLALPPSNRSVIPLLPSLTLDLVGGSSEALVDHETSFGTDRQQANLRLTKRASDGSRARRSRNLVCWKIPLQVPSTRPRPSPSGLESREISGSAVGDPRWRKETLRPSLGRLQHYRTRYKLLGFAKKSQLNGRWVSARPLSVRISDGAGTQAHAKKGKHRRLQQLS
jgi:hypothetical protein